MTGLAVVTPIPFASLLPQAAAATITVCPSGCDYTLIQAALDAALDGDVISVSADTYNESLSFPTGIAVTVQGAGAGSTVVSAAGLANRAAFVSGAGTVANIFDVTLTGGNFTAQGAGLAVGANATAYVQRVEISGNTTSNNGGGIWNAGLLTLLDSVVTGNQAALGGGINNFDPGNALIVRTEVSNNTATGSTAGGINTNSTTLFRVVNSTLSGNVAGSSAHELAALGNTELNNVTIYNALTSGTVVHQAFGTLGISNTVIVNDNTGSACSGTITSNGYNLIGRADSPGCTVTAGTGDLVGELGSEIDPQLGPLGFNGGPTRTHLPSAASPLIDAGNPAAPGSSITACELTDQRGQARNLGSGCDIGAVEAAVAVTIQDLIDVTPSGGTLNLVEEGLCDLGVQTIHYEQLTINDAITLIGTPSDPDKCVLANGESFFGPIIETDPTAAGAAVTIDGFTIADGDATNGGGMLNVDADLSITNTWFFNNNATNGGAIYNAEGGTLTVADSIIGDATNGGNFAASGGGIYATGDGSGSVDITNTSIDNNVALNGNGGAIWVEGTTLTLTGTTTLGEYDHTVAGNTGDSFGDNGGALYLAGSDEGQAASAFIDTMLFSGNVAGSDADGGAIYSGRDVTLEISSSEFSRNGFPDSAGYGPAIYAAETGSLQLIDTDFVENGLYDLALEIFLRCACSETFGGAVYSVGADVDVLGGTFDGNESDLGGGAIWIDAVGAGTSLTVDGTSFVDNLAEEDGGGAIYANGDAIIVDITGATFTTNTALAIGGAVSSDTTTAGRFTITDTDFVANTAGEYGGALNLEVDLDSTVDITGGTFLSNVAETSDGGAINGSGGVWTITGATFTGNSAAGNGGAAWLFDDDLTLSGLLVDDNSATDGGGLWLRGAVDIVGGSVVNNQARNEGGGIYFDGGTLTVSDGALVSNNTAGDETSDPLTAMAGYGGGIYVGEADESGTPAVTIIDSSLTLNTALAAVVFNGEFNELQGGDGGGIYGDFGAQIDVVGSTVSNNNADRDGGGVYFAAGELTVTESTIDGNDAATGNGGGLWVQDLCGECNYFVAIVRSTISNNTALTEGGAGGGIFNNFADTSIQNSTISGNAADSFGGGVYQNGFSLTVSGSTIVDNTALDGGGTYTSSSNSITFDNSILALNSAEFGPNCAGEAEETHLGLAGFNLIGDDTDCGINLLTSDPEIIGSNGVPVDPELGPLQDNGGATFTHLPSDTSPVVDKANLGLAVDQRNEARPADQPGIANAVGGNGTDIGSVELASVVPPVTLEVDNQTPDQGVSTVPLNAIPPDVLTTGTNTGQSQAIANTDLGDLEAAPVNSIPVNSIPVNSIELLTSPVNSIPVNSIPVNSIAADVLDTVLLSDVPVAGGWTPLLAGSPLAGRPLQTISLLAAISDPVVAGNIEASGISISQLGLQAAPVNSIPVSSIVLGSTPVNSIPLNSIGVEPPYDDGEKTLILEQWCAALAGTALDCATLGINPAAPNSDAAAGTTLFALSVAGAPVNSIPVNSIPVNSIDLESTPVNSIPVNSIPVNSIVLSPSPVNSIPVNSIDMAASPVNSIPVNSIPVNSIDPAVPGLNNLINCASPVTDPLTEYDCQLGADSGDTLGDVPNGAWIANYGLLIEALYDAGAFDEPDGFAKDFTLADLLAGMPDEITLDALILLLLPPEQLPWQGIDLSAVNLAQVAPPGTAETVEYTATITGIAGDLALDVNLPNGFAYVPGSSLFDPPLPTQGAALEPAIVAGASVSWTIVDVPVGQTHSLTFTATTSLDIGPGVASASVAPAAGGGSLGTATVLMNVQDELEPNDTPGAATEAEFDTFYVGHMEPDDRDFYVLRNVPIGAEVTAIVSNMSVDIDVAIYGPVSGRLRGAPERIVVGVGDPTFDVINPGEAPPESVNDIPFDPNYQVLAVSSQRGTTTEVATTGPVRANTDFTDIFVQLSSFNGAADFRSHLVQFSVKLPPAADACLVTPPTGGTAGSVGPVPSDVNTLFILNQQRLGAVYGDANATAVRNALDVVANQPGLGVIGAVVPVETSAPVADAYSAWNANPCSVTGANNVARTVAELIDGYRDTYPTIENVVLVGGDELIPQFRVPDETTLSPENTYLTVGTGNPLSAALGAGYLLTDDPFGDAHPLLADGREIFVTEVALGRLVETPADMLTQLNQFTQFNGLLDPTTATDAFVTAYDFLLDGGFAVAEQLDDTGRPVDTTLINDTWTKANLVAAWLTGTRTVSAVNGHFDHYRGEPADSSGGLLAANEVNPGSTNPLKRSIIFSMGCHAALSVNNVQVSGAPLGGLDWPEAISRQGGTLVGNTGYGYGDTDAVALSELLMTYFAAGLDGNVTAGQSLQFAKQRYASEELVYGAFDAKVIMEATYYGLPFYRVGGGGAPVLEPTPLPTQPVTGTNITVADIEFELPIGTALEEVTTPRGSFFRFDDAGINFLKPAGYAYVEPDGSQGLQVTPFRPIQPRVEIPASQVGLVAHGTLITSLRSEDVVVPDVVVSRPTVDLTIREPEPLAPPVFPTVFQGTRRFQGPGGLEDQVVFVPGQFVSNDGVGGAQRLFTRIAASILYAEEGETDFTAPTILNTNAFATPTGATFGAKVFDAESAVLKVLVLYQDDNPATPWLDWGSVELVDQGGGIWTGSAVAVSQIGSFYVQAVDAAGNVGISSNKGNFYLILDPPAPTPNNDVIVVAGLELEEGWNTSQPISVSLNVGPGEALYSLDGAKPQPYSGPFPVIGEGTHAVVVFTAAGIQVAQVGIDTQPPVVNSPLGGSSIPVGSPATVQYTCEDAASGVASCSSSPPLGTPIDTSSPGPGSFTVTTTDNVGNSVIRTFNYLITAPPTASIAPNLGAVPEGTTVGFTATTDAAQPVAGWRAKRNGVTFKVGTGSSFGFKAADDGAYQVELIVRDLATGLNSVKATETFVATNVDPTIAISGNAEATALLPYALTIGPVTDPGTDKASAFTIHWGDGNFDIVGALGTSEHVYTGAGTYTITVDVTDEDGTFTEVQTPAPFTVEVVKQVTSISYTGDTEGQYSDVVDLSATLVDGDAQPLAAKSVEFTIGTQTVSAVTNALGVATTTLTLDQPATTTTVTAEFSGDPAYEASSDDVTFTILAEDASAAFDDGNPNAVPVTGPGSDASDPFTLTVHLTDPDTSQGDLRLGDWAIVLTAIGPGSGGTATSCTETGSATELSLSCSFSGLPVNTYAVGIVDDAGFYVVDGEDVLVVYDASLGFATGGGSFLWPGTDDKTNFGFTMSYNKKGTNVKGSFLMIRHTDDGSYRVKSNALYGLALGSGGDYGWASFAGKANYRDAGAEDGVGNHEFTVYVEDRDDGPDVFWVQITDKDREVIDVISMPPPASSHATPLIGGNISVPHKPARGGRR